MNHWGKDKQEDAGYREGSNCHSYSCFRMVVNLFFRRWKREKERVFEERALEDIKNVGDSFKYRVEYSKIE